MKSPSPTRAEAKIAQPVPSTTTTTARATPTGESPHKSTFGIWDCSQMESKVLFFFPVAFCTDIIQKHHAIIYTSYRCADRKAGGERASKSSVLYDIASWIDGLSICDSSARHLASFRGTDPTKHNLQAVMYAMHIHTSAVHHCT